MSEKKLTGGCFCGAIRFEVDVDLEKGSNRCNCSFCTKARAWFVLVGDGKVRVLKGGDAHTEFQWTPPKQDASHLHYQFCKTCGVRAFGWGDDPKQGGAKFYFVSVPALDLTPEELAAIPINYADGRNDRHSKTPEITSWI